MRAISNKLDIRKLKMHKINITDEEGAEIFKALRYLVNLKLLVVSDNSLGEQSAKALSHSIVYLKRLRVLNIGNNRMNATQILNIIESSTIEGMKQLNIAGMSLSD